MADDNLNVDDNLSEVSEQSNDQCEESVEEDEAKLEDRVENLKAVIERLKEDIKSCREFNKQEKEELEVHLNDIEGSQRREREEEGEDKEQKEFPSHDLILDSVSEIGPLQKVSADSFTIPYCPDYPSYTSPVRTTALSLSRGVHSFSDIAVSNYERTSTNRRSDIARSQLESRLRIRREFAVNTYRQQLLEVEKLCQQELLRVEQNVCQLEPLSRIASGWNLNIMNTNAVERNRYLKHDMFVQELQFIGAGLKSPRPELTLNGVGDTAGNYINLFSCPISPGYERWSDDELRLSQTKYRSSESVI